MQKLVEEAFLSMGFSLSSEADGRVILTIDEETQLPISFGTGATSGIRRRQRMQMRRELRRTKRILRKASYRIPRHEVIESPWWLA